MKASEVTQVVCHSFEHGIQWLCRRQSEGGGWGDDQVIPTVGVTGHVLLTLADLGLSGSHLFEDHLVFLGRVARKDSGRHRIYWSHDLLQTYSAPKGTMGATLLAVLPIAQYENGFHYAGVDGVIVAIARVKGDGY